MTCTSPLGRTFPERDLNRVTGPSESSSETGSERSGWSAAITKLVSLTGRLDAGELAPAQNTGVTERPVTRCVQMHHIAGRTQDP